MNLEEFEKSAYELMNLHLGLNHGWIFKWSHQMTRGFGICDYRQKQIRLSKSRALADIKARNYSRIEDTIRHEIAHAMTPGAKHGTAWKHACRKTGAVPQQYKTEGYAKVDPKWVVYSAKSKRVYQNYMRKPSARTIAGLPSQWYTSNKADTFGYLKLASFEDAQKMGLILL